jgi:hypothetical protein
LPRLDFRRGLVGVEFGVRGLDPQLPAVRHRVARIDRKVEHRVLKLARIDGREPQIGRMAEFDFDVRAERAMHQRFHPAQQFLHVGRARLQHLPAPEGEQAPRQVGAALGRHAHGFGERRSCAGSAPAGRC